MKKTNNTVSLKDVSKEVAVSAMTVSKALNGKGGDSADTIDIRIILDGIKWIKT